MNINLIGSNGSLASAIGRYCNVRGHHLNVFGRSVPQKYHCDSFVEMDLMEDSLDNPSLYDADIIVYAAGAGVQSYRHDADRNIYRLNVEVPILLHNHLCHNGIGGGKTLVSFGSYFEIGENSVNRSFTENDLLLSMRRVPNSYCISKRLLTRYFSSAPDTASFLHFILPTVYGENENENENRLIPYLLRAIRNKDKLSFTSGEQVRQYLYVDEVPGVMEEATNRHIPSGIYNIEGNETLSVKNLVCMLLEAHGITPDMSIFGTEKRQDEGMKILQLDGSKLNSLIDHHCNHTILSVLGKYGNNKDRV